MLIFTHLCRVVAVLGLLLSAFMLLDAFNSYRFVDAAAATTHFDRQFSLGARTLFGSIVLGVLAEISFSVRKDG